MSFIEIIRTAVILSTDHITIPLFLFSAVMLISGIFILVQSQAVKLAPLEHKPLNWIEKAHPHIPSARLIVTFTLCTVTLLLVAFQIMRHTLPFSDPYQGLNLTSFFLLGGAVGILSELKWKGAKDYACAILTGTSIAYLLLILKFGPTSDSMITNLLPIFLLIPSMLIIGHTISRSHHRRILLTSLGAFCFWIFVYSLQ